MPLSDNTAIITFRSTASFQRAPQVLAKIPGFVSIRKSFDRLLAILIEYDPSAREFIFSAPFNFESDIAAVDPNYEINTCGFEQLVPRSAAVASSGWQLLRTIHRLGNYPVHLAGSGVCIAVADSGMSPHPFLPALTYEGAVAVRRSWSDPLLQHPRLTAHINQLVSMEADPSYCPFPVGSMEEAALASASLDVFSHLTQQALNAPGAAIASYAHAFSRALCGGLRRVSPYSRSFIGTDMSDLEDRSGHGTQMVGLLSSLPPYSPLCSGQSAIACKALEPDVTGIVPAAEIMVLRCLDGRQDAEGNVDTLIDALLYARDQHVDMVLVALQIRPQTHLPYHRVFALQRAIQELRKAEILVICPAGNDGGVGLLLPAGLSEAVAVTGLGVSRAGHMDVTSNRPSRTEKVEFTAVSEVEDKPILSATNWLGFTPVVGSSVSAAVVTGTLGLWLSERYRRSDRSLGLHRLENQIARFNAYPEAREARRLSASLNRAAELLHDGASASTHMPNGIVLSKDWSGNGLIRGPMYAGIQFASVPTTITGASTRQP